MSRAGKILARCGIAAAVLIAVVFAGINVYAVMFGRQMSRMATARIQCRSNLRQIYMACCAYRNDFASFPPAVTTGPDGTPYHSWRALLLPYLPDAEVLAGQYRLDEPWNGPHNVTIAQKWAPSDLICPSYPKPTDPITSYVMADRSIVIGGRRVLIWEVYPAITPWTLPDRNRSGQPSPSIANLVGFGSLHDTEYYVPLRPRAGAHVLFEDGTIEYSPFDASHRSLPVRYNPD